MRVTFHSPQFPAFALNSPTINRLAGLSGVIGSYRGRNENSHCHQMAMGDVPVSCDYLPIGGPDTLSAISRRSLLSLMLSIVALKTRAARRATKSGAAFGATSDCFRWSTCPPLVWSIHFMKKLCSL